MTNSIKMCKHHYLSTLGKFHIKGKVRCQTGCGEGEHQAQGLKKESYVQHLLFVNEMQ